MEILPGAASMEPPDLLIMIKEQWPPQVARRQQAPGNSLVGSSREKLVSTADSGAVHFHLLQERPGVKG